MTALRSNSVSKTKLLTLLNGPSFLRLIDRHFLISSVVAKQRRIVVRLSITKVPHAPIEKSNGKSPSRLTVHSETTEILNQQ